MKTSRAALSLAAALALAPSARAAVGTEAASFLESDTGARSVALAGAYTAVADDNLALFHNAAGLALIQRPELDFAYVSGAAGESLQHLSYSHPVGRSWTAAFGATYSGSGAIDKLDAAGNNAGSFSGTGLMTELALAGDLGWGFMAGAAGKFVRESLDTHSGTAEAFDAGVLYDISGLRLGAAVANVGTRLTVYKDAAPLPRTVKFGASYSVLKGLVVSADGRKVGDGKLRASIGSELKLPGYDTCDYFAFRLGYIVRNTEDRIPSAVVGGFGLAFLRDYQVDFALMPEAEMGNLFIVSMTLRFGEAR